MWKGLLSVLPISLLALSALMLPACSTEQRAATRTEDQRLEALKQERKMYQERVQAQLRGLETQIDILKQQMKAERRTGHKQLDERMAVLEQRRKAADQMLDKLNASSEVAWQNMKVGFESAMRELQNAYAQAAARFK
jgi:TolA-binding protein